MKAIETGLDGCVVIEPDVFGDDRGYFYESYRDDKYKKLGIHEKFVQDNFSCSSLGTLRGLHSQIKQPQGKLVSVTQGKVFDVAVDVRPSSVSFGKYFSIILSEKNQKQLYIPPGCAHGFLALSEIVHFFYKCTMYYDSNDELGIIWNDKALGIDWPIDKPILSKKDENLLTFKEYMKVIEGNN